MDLTLFKYEEFLKQLDALLQNYFEEQKEFLYCQKGCSHCCKKINIPLTKVEFLYMRKGIEKLDKEIKDSTINKIIEVYNEQQEFLSRNPNIHDFDYDCPFLCDNECILYDYRPIKCRVHGLIWISEKDNSYKIPGCLEKGLNYANVWNKKMNVFSLEKAKELNIKGTPEAFNLSHSTIIKAIPNFDFGEVKTMPDWLNTVYKA